MDYENTAKKILQRVGGKDNVINLVHCMTRLRFTLKDESIVDDEAVKKTKGVMGIMKKGGQYQIIIGNDVGNVFNELNKLGNFSNEVKEVPAKSNEKKNIFTMLMDTISGIMAPVIPAIIGAAMIKVLLTLLPMIGVLSTNGQTYQLLSVIGDGAFFFMPVVTKNFLKPMLVVLIEAPIALIILGPLGAICGNGLSTVVYAIHDKLGFIAIGLVAGVYPFVVMAGMHHAFTPIKLGMIATTGYENFICIGELCSNMAQGAASLAVALRSKNKDFKQIAGSSAFSALFAGITEPALYGVTLRLKRPMLGACIGGAVGGLVGGFFQMKCFGIATPAIVTIVQYVEKGKPQTLLFAALTILVTVVVTFVATLIIGFEDIVDEDDDLDFVEESNAQLLDNEISITSPVEGKVIPLTEVKDPTFSQEILGKGAAIIPEKGVVYAPFDGKVDAVFETGHALGLVSEDGVELLVHVGIDTVNLKGKYFTPKKKSGDAMKKGDILLEFDIDKIKADGYDVTTPIIISNTEQFAKVKACEDKVVTKESKLLSVQ